MARESRDVFPGIFPIGATGNLYIQLGNGAFSGVYTDTTDVPVRTQLTHVDFAAALVYDTYSIATDANDEKKYILFVDKNVSSGAVAVYRSSQGAVSGLPFNYVLIGRVESTD